ncbi:Na(+)/H(+) antiporter subunit E [Planctomycetes bacterium Pla163]|uniref:Na(+)/H(+) antiporter subunit E n=1 Tax=Rohdeia mirabilis TaxID=2528008 RepID=A0A518CW67_9BACT|nr:Na(+)/H(+) antiporter subunit E [Planctomycetes bacterium Pla163]
MIPKAIVLGLAWLAFTGHFGWDQFAFGCGVGLVLLFLTEQRAASGIGSIARIPRLVALGLYFAKELCVANLRVARAVVGNKYALRPGVVRVPLDGHTDRSVTVLANLITLTPGTLTIDVEGDRSALYVHCLDVDDPDAVRDEIKNGFERRVLGVFA